jgi:probable phosphoglycerate mutase
MSEGAALRDRVPMFARPFYYLRHGETEANVRLIIAGSLDVDLTPLGREQARAAARAFAAVPITAVYSSPLKRARETAEPIAHALNLPVTVLAEIAERNWGELEGKPRGTHLRGSTPPGGESTKDFMQRVLAGLSRIDAQVPLVVAHSGIFRVLCRTLDIAEPEGPVTNAWPLRFLPLAEGGWRMEPVDGPSQSPQL